MFSDKKLGSGVLLFPGTDPLQVSALFSAGRQVGVRYFFTPNIAVNGELGDEKSLANVGFTFKVGK